MAQVLDIRLPPGWLDSMALTLNTSQSQQINTLNADGTTSQKWQGTYNYSNADYNVMITITPK